jgi:hypothetical protein
MTIIKNILSVMIFIVAILVMLNAWLTVVNTSIHQIYNVCNYILATLLGIWSYLLADFSSKNSAE